MFTFNRVELELDDYISEDKQVIVRFESWGEYIAKKVFHPPVNDDVGMLVAKAQKSLSPEVRNLITKRHGPLAEFSVQGSYSIQNEIFLVFFDFE